MKQLALAASLLAAAGLAFAQAPAAPAAPANVPRANCPAKPEYPGRMAMQSDLRRNAFMREIDAYKTCMMAFVEENKQKQAAALAAANGAIQEYNDTMKKIQAAQEEAKGQVQ